MTPALLVLAMMAYDPTISEVDADRLSLAAFQAGHEHGMDRVRLVAVAWVESRWRLDGPCSKAGACGVTGILAGRYGNPSREELTSRRATPCPWCVAMDRGAHWHIYFDRHCKGECLCCYNQGWTERPDCSYARKVRGVQSALVRLGVPALSATRQRGLASKL